MCCGRAILKAVPSKKLPGPDELDLNAQFTTVSQLADQRLPSSAEAINQLSGLRLPAGGREALWTMSSGLMKVMLPERGDRLGQNERGKTDQAWTNG
jgi:hypothetical protein